MELRNVISKVNLDLITMLLYLLVNKWESIKLKFQMIAESLGKTLAWTLWNSIFGFAPMFVIIFINFKSFLFPDTPTDSMLTWGGIGQKVMSTRVSDVFLLCFNG